MFDPKFNLIQKLCLNQNHICPKKSFWYKNNIWSKIHFDPKFTLSRKIFLILKSFFLKFDPELFMNEMRLFWRFSNTLSEKVYFCDSHVFFCQYCFLAWGNADTTANTQCLTYIFIGCFQSKKIQGDPTSYGQFCIYDPKFKNIFGSKVKI